MIFQGIDVAALNPVMRVGEQIAVSGWRFAQRLWKLRRSFGWI